MKIVKISLLICSVLWYSNVLSQENYIIILDGKEVMVNGQTNQIIPNLNIATSTVHENINGLHIVKPKENLYRISKAYGMSVEQLCKLNSLKVNSTLKIGQKLSISPQHSNISEDNNATLVALNFYKVVKGDTLYSVAKKYGISVTQIKQMNNLSSNIIFLNQKLRIK